MKTHKFYESIYFVMSLAVVGGFLDAYTYVARGGVFANAQTGNVVLVGVYLAVGKWLEALKVIPSIAAFIFGIIAVEMLKGRQPKIGNSDWVTLILSSKIILLFLIGLIPATVPDFFVIVLVSFLASVQVTSFRRMVDHPCSTTMITGNMRYGMDHAISAIRGKDTGQAKKALRYLIVVMAFLGGALIGGFFINLYGLRSIWFCSLILSGLLLGYHWNKNHTESEL